MSMLNIVIHMLFASTAGLSVEREVEVAGVVGCGSFQGQGFSTGFPA